MTTGNDYKDQLLTELLDEIDQLDTDWSSDDETQLVSFNEVRCLILAKMDNPPKTETQPVDFSRPIPAVIYRRHRDDFQPEDPTLDDTQIVAFTEGSVWLCRGCASRRPSGLRALLEPVTSRQMMRIHMPYQCDSCGSKLPVFRVEDTEKAEATQVVAWVRGSIWTNSVIYCLPCAAQRDATGTGVLTALTPVTRKQLALTQTTRRCRSCNVQLWPVSQGPTGQAATSV